MKWLNKIPWFPETGMQRIRFLSLIMTLASAAVVVVLLINEGDTSSLAAAAAVCAASVYWVIGYRRGEFSSWLELLEIVVLYVAARYADFTWFYLPLFLLFFRSAYGTNVQAVVRIVAYTAAVHFGMIAHYGQTLTGVHPERDIGHLVALLIMRALVASTRREETHERVLGFYGKTSNYALIRMSMHGRIRHWDEGAHRMLGHTAAEMRGKPFTRLAVDSSELGEALRDAGADGQAELSCQIKRLDGEIRDIELVVSCDDDDENPGLFAFLHDVTDTLRSARELRDHQTQLRTIINSASLTLWAADGEERLTMIEGMYPKLVPGVHVGMPLTDLLDDNPELLAACRKALNGKTVTLRAQMGDRWFAFQCLPQPPLEDSDHRMIGLAVDVTDQVAAETQAAQFEAQLMQAQRMETVGSLAGGIAHDFNNLMSVILSYSDFVAEDVQGNERASRDVAEIRRAGERAVALTSRLLAFSRKERVTSAPIDVAAVVRDMHDLLQRTLHEDITLQFNIGDDPVCAVADVTQIEQVLLNLAVNAADAMPDGGTLDVSVRRARLDARRATEIGVPAGDYTVLTVKDTGVGMDAETAARAFDPFFTTKDPGRGTGLGLSIVYNIATGFSGTAQIVSQPGAGTAVAVYLPSCEYTERDLVQVDIAPPPGNAHVLIVEDEPAVAHAARRILENHGYMVTVATNPHQALKLISDERFDLLLSDVVMPAMNGPQLAVQARGRRPQLKILFMSGYAVATAGLDSTDTVVSKPLEPLRLLNAVHDALSCEEQDDG